MASPNCVYIGMQDIQNGAVQQIAVALTANQGRRLVHVVPNLQRAGGDAVVTMGLWLFFEDPTT